MKRAAPAFLVLFTGLILLAGCGKKDAAGAKKSQGPSAIPVTTLSVQTGSIAATVPVTGSMQALEDVSLAAKVSARVVAVTVREGAYVHAGQLLVQQDTTDLRATVQQQQAAVQNAQSQVAQAVTNYQIQVAQARQNVLNAQAQLAAAQYNYSKVKQGSRPQQVLQSQAGVEQAQANLDNANITLKRNHSLFDQGAIARADLDTAQTAYNVDLQLLNNAKAALSLTKAGNYPQDISYALEQVKEQQTNVANQIASEQQILVRKQQIQAAQAGVAQARATLGFDQQQVAYASIYSPISGIVAARTTEPGQIASPTSSVMRIVNVNTMYYEPTISESDFATTEVGDPVTIAVDALPGHFYAGKVAAVYPAASTTNRVFSLRVTVPDPREELRPGMFARGSVQTAVHQDVVVVPVAALVPLQLATNPSSEGTATGTTTLPPQQVYLVSADNKAMSKPVTVGIVTATHAEITSGLSPGDQLIVVGQDTIQPGETVQVENSPGGGHRHRPQTAAAF